MSIRLLRGDCRETLATLRPGSVQACITSPPFYGLRSYGTPDLVWGGDAECTHKWGGLVRAPWANNVPGPSANHPKNSDASHWTPKVSGSLCLCGAWLGSLGLEPTPELFVQHLVECCRAVRRVLRDDGTIWVNMGDSYAGTGVGVANRAIVANQVPKVGPPIPGYKAKDLMEIPSMVAQALRADGWYLRSRIPWLKRNCLSGGTRVYVRSQKGEMPMTVKDMARLDPTTLKVWNGEKWTQIVSMWATPRVDTQVEIELRSGERIGCTTQHRWPTSRGLLPAEELRVGDVLKGSWLPKPEFGSTRRPANLSDEQVGWFVGLYMAEGSMSNGTIQIASHVKETERFERLCDLATDFDGTCRAHKTSANGMTINLTGHVLRGILEQYVGGRTAKDKHLTNRCWMRSAEFLRAVLDGYLSGDGHYDAKNQRWRLGFTRNYAWEGDLRTICARLNVDLRLKLATISYAGRDVPIFRGSIRFERSTKLWAKTELEIVRLGRSRGRTFWDIEVEDDPHTFALASGVLTHNSMPESVTDRPSTSVEYVFLLSKSARYYWDTEAVRVDGISFGRQGSERGDSTGIKNGSINTRWHKAPGDRYDIPGRSRRNGDWFFESWQGLMLDEQGAPLALVVNPAPLKIAHYASFPPKLVEPMVKASTRPGDTVLDPFAGAGTTLLVADRLGRNAIGCELSESYSDMGTARIVDDAPMFVELESAVDAPTKPLDGQVPLL